VLCAVAGGEILKIVDEGDALGLSGAEEIVLYGVGVVAEGDFDGALEAVDVWVDRVALVGLVLSHKREEFLSGPALGLEVVVWSCLVVF
jgi:hypothetical protein